MSAVPSYIYKTVLMGSDIALKFYERQDETAKQALLLIKQWEDRLTVNGGLSGGGQGRAARQSEIAAVNAAAGLAPARVSSAVFALLARARAVSVLPQSGFNFAIGPVVKAWNVGFAAARVPQAAELAALLPLTDPRAVRLNCADYSVFLPQKGMALDLGAIAKGFIADCVKAFLRKRGIQSALINIGGNVHSVGAGLPAAAHGAKAAHGGMSAAQLWAVGLQKPFAAKGELLGLIRMADKSVVTSGIYERYFLSGGAGGRGLAASCAGAERKGELGRAFAAALRQIGGARAAARQRPFSAAAEPVRESDAAVFYHHIFNPRTGYPLDNDLMSVTIISDASIDGEIWSSLLYAMGAKGAVAFLRAAAEERGRGEAKRRRISLDAAPPDKIAAGGLAESAQFLLLPRRLCAVFVTKDRQIIVPARKNFRFTLLDKNYRLSTYS